MIWIYNKDGTYKDTLHMGTEEEIKTQYGEVYTSEKYLGNQAVVESGTIRAKTNKEKLVDGELSLGDGQYINENGELTTIPQIPYSTWDSIKNEWIYDKELEIEYLENQLGTLEESIFNKENEYKILVSQKKTFAAKKVKKEIEEMQSKFDELLARYEELG